jgi:hypothetical protein
MKKSIDSYWAKMGYPWFVRQLITRMLSTLLIAQMNVMTGYTDGEDGIATFPGQFNKFGQATQGPGGKFKIPPLEFPLDARAGHATKYIIKGGKAGASNVSKLAYQIINTHTTGVDEAARRCSLEYLTLDPSYFFSYKRVSIQQIFNSENRAQWNVDLYDVDGDGMPKTIQKGQWIRRTVTHSLCNDGGVEHLHLHESCYEHDPASGEWDRLRATVLIKYVRET